MEKRAQRLLGMGLLLACSAFGVREVSSKESKTLAKIPFYPRPLDGPAFELLCLYSRQHSNPLLFGHSALTQFRLDPRKPGIALRARATGFWPFGGEALEDGTNVGVDLLENDSRDHFVRFGKNSQARRVGRICVPITEHESKKLDAFHARRKDQRWRIAYNCNDLSADAFEAITGISLRPRSGNPFCSTPKSMIDSIEKFVAGRGEAGTVLYQPKDSIEAARFLEAQKIQRGQPKVEENAPGPGHKKNRPAPGTKVKIPGN